MHRIKVDIFDFDGTIIRKNSFPLWILFIMKKSITTFSPKVFILFSANLILRKLNIITHEKLKHRLLLVDYPDSYNLEFMLSLRSSINKKVLKAIHTASNPLLSSAAPLKYIKYVNIAFGVKFESIIGSKIDDNGNLFNNISNKKVISLKKTHPHSSVDKIFTDHHDDLPLIKIADQRFIVSPSKETMEILKRHKINFTTI